MRIPEDIMVRAEATYDALGRGSNADAQVIARAILAERRRCAGVARGEAHADCGVAEQIATAIEAGT